MVFEDDILSEGFRRQVMEQITANENDERKDESRRRFEIWAGNLHEVVKEEMSLEYGRETIEKFRTQSSINFVPRIIEEKASIYKFMPDRIWENVTEEQAEYIDDKYEENEYNVSFKKANEFYKLQDQVELQIIPNELNDLPARVLQPHHYDIIESPVNPENKIVTILGINDETRHIRTFRDSTERKQSRNFVNQFIGDWDDKRKLLARFVWWSDNYNFITNGFGELISDPDDITNPLEVYPGIDVADKAEKDFTYWVFKESLLVRFQIDFSKDLTDLTENIKMRSNPVGVLIADKKPETVDIGPRKWTFLPLDPNNPEMKPSFTFVSGDGDIGSQMEVIKDKLAMYLSSENIDPKSIAGSLDGGQDFNSGLDRLLSQLQRFEATQRDFDLFRRVEKQFFELFKLWNNRFASEGVEGYQMLPDDAKLNINFHKPEKLETQDETETRLLRLMNEGILPKKRAIMKIMDVSKEDAEEIILELDQELVMQLPEVPLIDGQNDSEEK